MSTETIAKLTQVLADARASLSARVDDLQAELEAAKRRRLPGIRRAVAAAACAQDELHAYIDGNRDLFTKPRSLVLAGIRVGLQKGKGKLKWEDEEMVLKKIRQLYDDQIGTLISVTYKPNKEALVLLPAAELKKLGITVTGTGDQVMIKPVDNDVDKLVNALLKDAVDTETMEDAA